MSILAHSDHFINREKAEGNVHNLLTQDGLGQNFYKLGLSSDLFLSHFNFILVNNNITPL